MDFRSQLLEMAEGAGPIKNAIAEWAIRKRKMPEPLNPQLGRAVEEAVPALTSGFSGDTLTGRAIRQAAPGFPNKADPAFTSLVERAVKQAQPDAQHIDLLRRRLAVERMMDPAGAKETEAALLEAESVLHAKNAIGLERSLQADRSAGNAFYVNSEGIVSKGAAPEGWSGGLVQGTAPVPGSQMELFGPQGAPAPPQYGLDRIAELRKKLAAEMTRNAGVAPNPKGPGTVREAAFRNRETGEVVPTGSFHDLTLVPGWNEAKWEDGFIADHGGFLNRSDAASYVNSRTSWLESLMADELGQMTGPFTEAIGSVPKWEHDVRLDYLKNRKK